MNTSILAKQKGFSLVELLVVIAIIGMLSAVAVPAYREYILRAQVVEALSTLQKYKSDALASYVEEGKFAQSDYGTLCSNSNPCPGKLDVIDYGSINVSQSIWFRASFKKDAGFGDEKNKVIIFLKEDDGIINAYCGRWDNAEYIEAKYLPGGCKEENIGSKE